MQELNFRAIESLHTLPPLPINPSPHPKTLQEELQRILKHSKLRSSLLAPHSLQLPPLVLPSETTTSWPAVERFIRPFAIEAPTTSLPPPRLPSNPPPPPAVILPSKLTGVSEVSPAGMTEGRTAGIAETRTAGIAETRTAGMTEARIQCPPYLLIGKRGELVETQLERKRGVLTQWGIWGGYESRCPEATYASCARYDLFDYHRLLSFLRKRNDPFNEKNEKEEDPIEEEKWPEQSSKAIEPIWEDTPSKYWNELLLDEELLKAVDQEEQQILQQKNLFGFIEEGAEGNNEFEELFVPESKRACVTSSELAEQTLHTEKGFINLQTDAPLDIHRATEADIPVRVEIL